MFRREVGRIGESTQASWSRAPTPTRTEGHGRAPDIGEMGPNEQDLALVRITWPTARGICRSAPILVIAQPASITADPFGLTDEAVDSNVQPPPASTGTVTVSMASNPATDPRRDAIRPGRERDGNLLRIDAHRASPPTRQVSAVDPAPVVTGKIVVTPAAPPRWSSQVSRRPASPPAAASASTRRSKRLRQRRDLHDRHRDGDTGQQSRRIRRSAGTTSATAVTGWPTSPA